MSKRLALALPLAAIIIVSGCTDMSSIPFLGGLFGPPTVKYTNDVVIIRSLEATPSTVFTGQTVRLTAYIQNQGKETIDNGVFVDLYDYCQGTFQLADDTDCGGTKGGGSSCTFDKMYPYETREIRWTLKAADNIKLETVCPMDGVKVLVNYRQTTEGLSTISLIKYEEMQRQMSEGTYSGKTSFRAVGEGPIKGYITVEDKQPVPVSSEGESTTVISFQLRNEGNGFLAFAPGTDHKPEDKPTVKVEKIDMGGIGGIQTTDSDDKNCKTLTGGGDLFMILKESPKIVCPVGLTQKDFTKELSTTMKFGISYNYEFRASTKITVKPKAITS